MLVGPSVLLQRATMASAQQEEGRPNSEAEAARRCRAAQEYKAPDLMYFAER
jgi:hypothetical protein